MKFLSTLFIFCFLLSFTSNNLQATHNMAGRIEYQYAPLENQPYRYCFTVITYSRNKSSSADRDTLHVNFGDGSAAVGAARVNGQGEPLPHNEAIKLNKYEICHTYASTGTYIVSMQDPNRNADIINMVNSIDEAFFLQNMLLISSSTIGFNNSPIIFPPPIDIGKVGEPYVYHPNVYDPDGDNLVFELIEPLSNLETIVNGYRFPDEINTNPPITPNTLTIDSKTGELVWDSPRLRGRYAIAMQIKEYRSGILVGTMIWDIQVTIDDFNNIAPTIEPINDMCVSAGEKIDLMIVASDSGIVQGIVLEGFGAPFEIFDSPATFEVFDQGSPTVTGNFHWSTDCSHLIGQPYTIAIRASDKELIPLTQTETWSISLSPPPVNVINTSIENNGIQLSWESNLCADSEKFRGYTVWRKEGCHENMDNMNCALDLFAEGFEALNPLPIELTSYLDESAEIGKTYSYQIFADFANVSFLNPFSSLPSETVCVMPTNIGGVSLNDNLPFLEVFPNPITDFCQVRFSNLNSLIGKQLNLTVYDAQGKRMENWSIPTSSKDWSLGIGGWESGLYFLQLEVNGAILEVKKMVVD